MKQIEYIGNNSIKNLKTILTENDVKSVFLVTGKKSYENTNIKNIIEENLSGVDFFRFSDFEVNPKIEDLKKGIEIFKENKFDIVVSIGGGTVIDMGKMINFFGNNSFSIDDFLDGMNIDISDKITKSIGIPTTTGTGAESTHFAVLYRGKTKYSIANKNILASHIILDNIFLEKIPNQILGPTILDSLSQCIESYWSVQSTEESKTYAKKGLNLLIEVFSKINSLENLTNDSKQDLLLASNFSGKAINISKTTACHAISYPMTSYFNIPHGYAAALTLGEMFIFNKNIDYDSCLDKRGIDYVNNNLSELLEIFGLNDGEKFKEHIDSLILKLGLENKLSKLGLIKKDLNIIIENGFNPDRVKNNPRLISKKELENILFNIF